MLISGDLLTKQTCAELLGNAMHACQRYEVAQNVTFTNHFIICRKVWGVKSDVTHQTSCLVSTVSVVKPINTDIAQHNQTLLQSKRGTTLAQFASNIIQMLQALLAEKDILDAPATLQVMHSPGVSTWHMHLAEPLLLGRPAVQLYQKCLSVRRCVLHHLMAAAAAAAGCHPAPALFADTSWPSKSRTPAVVCTTSVTAVQSASYVCASPTA